MILCAEKFLWGIGADRGKVAQAADANGPTGICAAGDVTIPVFSIDT